MTAPGVKPPTSIESEETRRPTPEEGLRWRAASTAEGVARPVGICEKELIAAPQEEQKRPESETSEEQLGQRINSPESYPEESSSLQARRGEDRPLRERGPKPVGRDREEDRQEEDRSARVPGIEVERDRKAEKEMEEKRGHG